MECQRLRNAILKLVIFFRFSIEFISINYIPFYTIHYLFNSILYSVNMRLLHYHYKYYYLTITHYL